MSFLAIDSATPQVSLAIARSQRGAGAGPSGQERGSGSSGRERGSGSSGRERGSGSSVQERGSGRERDASSSGVEILASLQVNAGRRHAETLAPGIAYLMEAADVARSELSFVVVDVGPGLFTGLRVGVATAKALGAGLDIPVVGVTSTSVLFRAYASGPANTSETEIAAVVDARRGDVFWGRGQLEPQVSTPELAVKQLAEIGSPAVAVGDGAIRYAEVFAAAGIEVAAARWSYPDARTLAVVGQEAEARGEAGPAGEIHPLYLRPPDVRIGWEQAEALPTKAAGGSAGA